MGQMCVDVIYGNILSAAANMKPVLSNSNKKQYVLENAGKAYILYNASAEAFSLDLTKQNGSFIYQVQDTKNGAILKEAKVNAGSSIKIDKVANGDEVIILKKI